MEFMEMVNDAFEYTKEALVDKWMRWLILIVGTIIFPISFGYILLIARGGRSPPDPEDWVSVFIDGIKLFIVGLIWLLPVIIISALLFGSALALFFTGGSDSAFMALAAASIIGVPLLFVFYVLAWVFIPISAVRFARTDSFGEAFNFSAILAHIGRIGWGNYIIALIVLFVIQVIFGVLRAIPFLGVIIWLVLAPAFFIFAARYITMIYDSSPVPA